MKKKGKVRKCKYCSNKAEFYIQENNKTIYLCENHSMKILLKEKRNLIPRIKN